MDKMIIALSLVVLGSLIQRAWGETDWSCKALVPKDEMTSFKVICNDNHTITFKRIRVDYLDERYSLKATKENAGIFCLQQKLEFVSFDVKNTFFGTTAVAVLVDNAHKVEQTLREGSFIESVTCK